MTTKENRYEIWVHLSNGWEKVSEARTKTQAKKSLSYARNQMHVMCELRTKGAAS